LKDFKTLLIGLVGLGLVAAALFGRNIQVGEISSQIFRPSSSNTSDETLIVVHYHERKPYYETLPDGVRGLCADPLKLVFEKAGVSFRWEKTPPKRQLEILKHNPGRNCFLGWFKTPERKIFAKFSLYIYQDKPTIALARSDNDKISSGRSLKDILSNQNLVLLRKDGYSYGKYIDEQIGKIKPATEITSTDNLGMLQMIQSGRADYFFIAQEEAEVLIDVSGALPKDLKYIRFTDVPKGNRRYIMFSPLIEDEFISRINTAIRTFIHEQEKD
jgi:polar amino acid transport system substrate-binding protein